jgi:hypothetical protein
MAADLIVQDVAPLGTGYLILMGVLAAGLRLLRRDQLGSPGQAGGEDPAAEARPAEAAPAGAAPAGAAPAGAAPAEAAPAEAPPPGAPSDAGGAPGSGGKRPGAFARHVPAGWPRFAVQVCSVALGGYLLLMAVDLLYYYGVVKIRGQFIESGFTGGLTLIAIALPLWGLASWLSLRRGSR